MVTLLDLEPEFLKVIDERMFHCEGVSIDEADGICFLCPKCFAANSGSCGTHSVICWRPNVPQTIHPTPGRWDFRGNGFEDLSLVAGSSSILLHGGCNAHFFVENGHIRMC